MNHQNWDTVIINGKKAKPRRDTAPLVSDPSSIHKKIDGGKNSNHGNGLPSLSKKLEGNDEIIPLPTISRSLSLQIIAARNQAGLTQKELAQKINEKIDVVKGYESGEIIPNPNVTNKLQRALNTTFTK
jgi:putative transcription factor